MLQVAALTKRFGGLLAVDAVAFTVERGSIHGLIGPNGSGKSTVLNLLSGLYRADAGSVRLRERDITRLRSDRVARAGIGRTFQEIQLFPDLTVLENAMVGCHRRGRAGPFSAVFGGRRVRTEEREIRERSEFWLDFLGIAALRNEPARTISYGHQRLLEIARGLCSEPDMLLLDEPAAGMNHAETDRLAGHIERIRAHGPTILLVEHNMKMVMGTCRRLTVLAHGRVIADGTPEQVQADEAVLEAYLGQRARPC